MSFAAAAQRALDACYRAFGAPARFTPSGGSAVDCTIIRKSADQVVPFGEARPFAEGDVICVRTSEVAAPARNGVFSPVSPDTWPSVTIIGDPQARDELRLEWTCRVA